MTKRSFFKRAMGFVACVALAPEIAFGVRLRIPSVDERRLVWAWRRTATGNLITLSALNEETLEQMMRITGVGKAAWNTIE